MAQMMFMCIPDILHGVYLAFDLSSLLFVRWCKLRLMKLCINTKSGNPSKTPDPAMHAHCYQSYVQETPNTPTGCLAEPIALPRPIHFTRLVLALLLHLLCLVFWSMPCRCWIRTCFRTRVTRCVVRSVPVSIYKSVPCLHSSMLKMH